MKCGIYICLAIQSVHKFKQKCKYRPNEIKMMIFYFLNDRLKLINMINAPIIQFLRIGFMCCSMLSFVLQRLYIYKHGRQIYTTGDIFPYFTLHSLYLSHVELLTPVWCNNVLILCLNIVSLFKVFFKHSSCFQYSITSMYA